jgi:hypothetical protein
MNFKRIVFSLLVICFVSTASSCFKHRRQIRVRNSFSTALVVKVGPADFGSVPSVKTTEYKDIPKGTLELSGDVSGSMTVPSGKHKYTLYINTVGNLSLIEEKN